ncbi:MAG: hypothetical protein MZV64_18160 [Ignavibacteriales bacterium]|nr:hypothetical protein [Ignavibacteriales bacterium]
MMTGRKAMERSADPLYDVAVIGGGRRLRRAAGAVPLPTCGVVLFERESDLAEGVSKGNSGVIHAGFNVPSGSLKARPNVAGLKA